ncbi:unnamed protein product [Bursaphelenchus xylophilus]|uniref:(pine wood nematode) hypothetical protein n=1 Tax=Bursaphelenchus xylophilus TaxID=6326 RepID=A0A1I7SSZ3_BURXY|nr:unnamed protein product [Bursaphelenchus xylophilus]CAG9108829.1 unnamed protein product [Bursaphelenchus xylophilus]
MQLISNFAGREYIVYEEYIITYFLIVLAASLIYGAWLISRRPPLVYRGHLVSMHRSETGRVVRIVSADNERIQIEDLVSFLSNRPNSDNSESVNALVVLSPSSTRLTSRVSTLPSITTVNLPLSVERHISQIYEILHRNTDASAAAATIISLFRPVARRLSSENHLFISNLLSEIRSADTVNLDNTSLENNNHLDAMPVESTDEGTNLIINSGENEEDRGITESPVAEEVEPLEANTTVKLKFMDDTEKIVRCNLLTTIDEFKKTHFSLQVADGKVVRLIYKGQLLRDDSRSLGSYGVHNDCVIHCHVGNRPYVQDTVYNNTESTNRSQQRAGHFGFESIPSRPIFTNMANENWMNRVLRVSIYFADMLPFMMFYGFSATLRWIQGVEQVDAEADTAWGQRQINKFRRALLAIIRLFVDFSVVQNQNVDDMFMNRFNLGILFTLLFTFKFASIWFVVLYFPQYTDTKGVVMLTMLTVVFILYTFYNRPRPAVNARVH